MSETVEREVGRARPRKEDALLITGQTIAAFSGGDVAQEMGSPPCAWPVAHATCPRNARR